MSLTFSDFWVLLRDSVLRPRAVMRRFLDAPVSPGWLWQALILLAIVAGMLAWGEFVTGPRGSLPFDPAQLPGPAVMAAMQFGLLAVLVPVTHLAGRLFGGQGTPIGALKLVVWWQALTMVLQTAELLLILAFPFLGLLAVIATFAAIFWTLSNGVAELHGFRSLGLVLLGIIGTGVVLILFASFILSAFGVAPMGAV
ncbi:hypothetical protein U879_06100 [Defluviimonas sp. 20V17]|uniref:YIP1 family protein n=1 Tax=Allgaiera indica TaxID=765699 RepID=A0AAN4UP59_9RHOB|nr:Yip1 family protein [Allgaiera indica]KDB04586.1 hypothetical protein U879_06100 [Defluviimonas sp. 20V17]GHD99769.1 YIP1 family protein [Allgaiera indica]SDW18865.1 Yip1 domain-containing protein [Allgaiera indica]